jgi:hypothetical protein
VREVLKLVHEIQKPVGAAIHSITSGELRRRPPNMAESVM